MPHATTKSAWVAKQTPSLAQGIPSQELRSATSVSAS